MPRVNSERNIFENSPTAYLVFVVIHISNDSITVLHALPNGHQPLVVSRKIRKHKHWVCLPHKCHPHSSLSLALSNVADGHYELWLIASNAATAALVTCSSGTYLVTNFGLFFQIQIYFFYKFYFDLDNCL